MRKIHFLLIWFLFGSLMAWGAAAQGSGVTLLSVPGDYTDAVIDNSTLYPSLSADGRYLAFLSNVATLVPNDTNALGDAFVLDRQTGQIERVSVTSAGAQAAFGACCDEYTVVISGNGRYVAFSSFSNDLVPDDTNVAQDIFLHDRQTGVTSVVSVDSSGNPANGNSYYPSISANGRFIAFESQATNLISDDTNGFKDVYVHDTQTGQTVRVSMTHDGQQSNHDSFITINRAISDDGRFVSFDSYASNLVPNDTNSVRDAFVHDRDADNDGIFDEPGATTTVRVSVATDGTEGNGHLAESYQPALAGNGRFVTFYSYATNLVADDTNLTLDVFVRDRDTDADGIFDEPGAVLTERVSVSSSGGQSNGGSGWGSMTADGRFVTFYSYATNLISGVNGAQQQIFLHDRQTGETIRLSETSSGDNPNNNSNGSMIAADGNVVAFTSLASNLVDGDTNGTYDVFLYDPTASPVSYQLYLPLVTR
ncbi:MAG: PD40 domain-containing protein [Ardenticatenaceae bacterium]|nr:PD40 domain-containing protein [Ardenticatenaceae bacterium]